MTDDGTAAPRTTALFDLTGRTALVTGGGRGIGRMCVEGLLRAGARVLIASRRLDDCRRTADELRHLGEVVPLQADLSDAAAAAGLAEQVRDHADALHLLVNNAGATWGADLATYPESGWDKVLAVNLTGPFFLVQALLPLLEEAASADDPARVVNVGSIDGLRVPTESTYAYSASKAGLHHLTKVLAVELGPRNITVNALAPGPFESKMMEATLQESRSDFEHASPLGRIGRPDDIAGPLVFLASRAATFVTGAVLPVDGGLSLRSPR